METFANANQNPGSSCSAPNRCAKDVAKLHAAPIAQKPFVTAGKAKKTHDSSKTVVGFFAGFPISFFADRNKTPIRRQLLVRGKR